LRLVATTPESFTSTPEAMTSVLMSCTVAFTGGGIGAPPAPPLPLAPALPPAPPVPGAPPLPTVVLPPPLVVLPVLLLVLLVVDGLELTLLPHPVIDAPLAPLSARRPAPTSIAPPRFLMVARMSAARSTGAARRA
jgi:hypothetical protein